MSQSPVRRSGRAVSKEKHPTCYRINTTFGTSNMPVDHDIKIWDRLHGTFLNNFKTKVAKYKNRMAKKHKAADGGTTPKKIKTKGNNAPTAQGVPDFGAQGFGQPPDHFEAAQQFPNPTYGPGFPVYKGAFGAGYRFGFGTPQPKPSDSP